MKKVKGYKVFNADWTCRGFQYVVGETFEEDVIPSCYDKGFHFCTKVSDCFNYYPFDSNNKVAEVEAIGKIDTNPVDSKCCTNKIRIVRELSWDEVLEIVNIGKGCTGLRNSGDHNSGHRNSGNYNSRNYNSGDWNSGDYNSGNWNSGDWNKTDFSSGCFNTKEQNILMFNKASEWTLNDWWDSEARKLLNQIQYNALEWIQLEDMTDEEKKLHPECKTTGGYLKELDKSECNQIWWDSLSDMERNIIRNIPNFDEAIFEEITGIKIERED